MGYKNIHTGLFHLICKIILQKEFSWSPQCDSVLKYMSYLAQTLDRTHALPPMLLTLNMIDHEESK